MSSEKDGRRRKRRPGDRYVDAVRSFCGFDDDAAWARSLGTSPSTMTGWRNRDEIPRDPWISEIAKRARVAESEIYALRERRGDDLGSRKRPLSVGGVDLDESSDTLELGFQVVTGFRGPRVDVHRMLEKGDPESVKNFLDWCRDMAHLALQAARDPSIARKTEASAEDALQRRDEAASTVVSEQEGQSAAAGGGGGTK